MGLVCLLVFFFNNCYSGTIIDFKSENNIVKKLDLTNDEDFLNFFKNQREVSQIIIKELNSAKKSISAEEFLKLISEATEKKDLNSAISVCKSFGLNSIEELIFKIKENEEVLHKVLSNNPELQKLSKSELEKIITEHYDNFIANHKLDESVIDLPNVEGAANHCLSDYHEDVQICGKRTDRNIAIALAVTFFSSFGGPLSGGLAYISGMATVAAAHTDCVSDAEKAYKRCLRG